jgi:hypothetical protein
MFSTDSDLVCYEPAVFNDCLFVSRRKLKGTASVSGTTLTFHSFDVAPDLARVEPGMIVLLGGTPVELVARISPTSWTVSQPRIEPTDPIVPPAPVSNLEITVQTFEHLRRVVSGQILAMLSIRADDAAHQAIVTNPRDMTPLETLTLLYLAYSLASSGGGPDERMRQKADLYRELARAQRRRADALIDTNSDGIPDAARSPDRITLNRL